MAARKRQQTDYGAAAPENSPDRRHFRDPLKIGFFLAAEARGHGNCF
jgi:hypothetical protein